MSEQLPAPDFDAQNYARPNQNWICDHACEGNACRMGPDQKGKCCATAECKPVLKTKEGETKGRWHCTRAGGECESGPLPDGSCCRPIAKCSPVATLRVWRGRVTLAVIAASCAVLLVVLGNPPWRNNFISPGTISSPHSGAAFAALAATNHLNPNCGACHAAGNSGPNGMVNAAMRAEPGIFEFHKIITATPAGLTAIDEACNKCHIHHYFHQTTVGAISCAFCHGEHTGKVMTASTDEHCSFCHGNARIMASAALNATSRSTAHFPRDKKNESLVFASPRPVAGFTEVIHHFAEDHPQFRFITEKLRDPDTLKFNHALHLTGTTIPKLPSGEKFDCVFCHSPGAAGAFMKPVAFEQNCRVCHSLQFDPATPELQLPHGSAEFVSAYLRSLPKQYLDLAAKQNVADGNNFVQQKLAGLRTQFGSGEDLEKRIFFSTATTAPEINIGNVSGATRAIFPGCALCHEVKNSSAGLPEITMPILTERWLAQAKFNHAAHANIGCAQCHDAVHSKDTADILLPPKETCATCHSPRGGVTDTCAECHTYHQPLVAAQ